MLIEKLQNNISKPADTLVGKSDFGTTKLEANVAVLTLQQNVEDTRVKQSRDNIN